MATIQVWPGEWPDFFEEFSHRHIGWSIKVEALDAAREPEIEVEGPLLEGIRVDDDRGWPAVSIATDDCQGGHLIHTVDGVRHVWVQTAANGAEEALEIAASGSVTRVTLRATARA